MNTNTDAFRLSASEWPGGSPQLAVPVTERDHVVGDPDAPVTVVQYGDYECAQCLNAEPIVKGLLRLHGRQMRFVFRHFPQYSLHPQASLSAQAAEAAGAQGKFWEMHDLLFRHRRNLAEAEITHLALVVGLEIYRFSDELSRGVHAQRVRADYVGGIQSGVSLTPTFFVNGTRIAVFRSFKAVSSAVETALQPHA